LCRSRRAEGTAGPRDIFNDYGLSHAFAELLRYDARDCVPAATCGKRHDDSDSLAGIILGMRADDGTAARKEQRTERESVNAAVRANIFHFFSCLFRMQFVMPASCNAAATVWRSRNRSREGLVG
jgi:hypothetical protein